jgi:SNF2 family DNA or RNA helicase
MASHVYLLEPQWNPSIEMQAIGRVARLGQKHPVRVVRYVVTDSIEEVQ